MEKKDSNTLTSIMIALTQAQLALSLVYANTEPESVENDALIESELHLRDAINSLAKITNT